MYDTWMAYSKSESRCSSGQEQIDKLQIVLNASCGSEGAFSSKLLWHRLQMPCFWIGESAINPQEWTNRVCVGLPPKNMPNIFASSKSATWTRFVIEYRQKTISMWFFKCIELYSFSSSRPWLIPLILRSVTGGVSCPEIFHLSYSYLSDGVSSLYRSPSSLR